MLAWGRTGAGVGRRRYMRQYKRGMGSRRGRRMTWTLGEATCKVKRHTLAWGKVAGEQMGVGHTSG